MSRAATAWGALQAALAVAGPHCQGDDRFTADDSEHDAALIEVCAGCPVRVECRAWALAAPTVQRFGFFAGVSRRGGRSREDRGRARTLTPEQVALIHQLRAEGQSFLAIADRMAISVTTVGRRVRLASQSN